ncbi:IclR family transcriptional regulator [Conexibacter arvalis]|uniref:Glycerol operon regulatory protein n=1 Tax=Conexibacter arvalis TaxID=912552 RepID=A0A840IC56_9ACTN|nr:IclR family transcriptional regulator [Conexibacter arvalis]MBB4662416.1 IclR family acetate operon transcriptional repressor [Conexibacter arvalis]
MSADQAERPSYTIRAVARVCEILTLLGASRGGATLGEIGRVTGLPRSSAFRYIATLEQYGFVERDTSRGVYRLGLAAASLHGTVLERLHDVARPHLERLRDALGETINLGRLDGNRVAYLDIVESRNSMRLAARPGDRDPIHSTALGKAIAAQLDVRQVKAILRSDGMPRLTDRTITTVDAYLDELRRVREIGYAVDDLENEPHGRCVAAAIPATAVPGGMRVAISQSAPAAHLAPEDVPAVGAALVRTAAELAAELNGLGAFAAR